MSFELDAGWSLERVYPATFNFSSVVGPGALQHMRAGTLI